jgi:poly(3-hydroxybutyrate) depolymerase
VKHLAKIFLLLILLASVSHPIANAGEQKIKTLQEIRALLLSKRILSTDQNQQISTFFLNHYKKQNVDLSKGMHRCIIQKTKDGGGYAGWFLKATAESHPSIYAEKQRHWKMRQLGTTGYFTWVVKFPNFSSVHWRYEINGKRSPVGGNNRFGFESYEWLADSKKQEDVPVGKLIPMSKHTSKIVYPGSARDWWVYVPVQYKKGTPAKLVVFNDGSAYCHGEGSACIVMDNLIHKKKIPVMIALFIQPGDIVSQVPGGKSVRNRSNEYDTCTAQFATFLEKEIFPIVYEKYDISKNPVDHAIVGASSGGSCAFTAAWHRPDLFRRVISFVGSFCDFRSIDDYPSHLQKKNNIPLDQFGPWKTAHDYPGLIRKTDPPKPIKVFLQDGDNDLDNKLGNWFLNNERMATALEFSGYDFKFVAGHGMHSHRPGKAILPVCMEWVWKDSKNIVD